MSAGKGDNYRPVNWDKYLDNYQAINWSKVNPSIVPTETLKAYGMPVGIPTASNPASRNLIDELAK